MEEIIEQGEGARGDWRTAHYGRFLTMWQEYHDLRQRDPSFEPARPVLPVYTRQPFGIAAPQPVITDPLTLRGGRAGGDGLRTGAAAAEPVLHPHRRDRTATVRVLIGAAIGMMAGVLRPLATALTTLPAGPPHQGSTAGFTFEVYYVLGNMVPWREPAWALLHERMALPHATVRRARTHGAPEAVHQAHQRAAAITATIAAHVPADLRPTEAALGAGARD